jgi:hypothetical protein
MYSFGTTTNAIIDWFKADAIINEVTSGDVSEVDLSTHTDFPLAHVIYTVPTFLNGFNSYSYQILLLDKFELAHEEKIPVIDQMAFVASTFMAQLNGQGLGVDRRIRWSNSPASAVIYDQFANRLYGISLEIVVKVPSDINCDPVIPE